MVRIYNFASELNHYDKHNLIYVLFSPSVLPQIYYSSFTAGLVECIATSECAFEIQTKDSFGNNCFNNGTDPNFDITLVGIGGWALEGRVNDFIGSSPVEVSSSISSVDWQLLGTVDVTNGSSLLRSATNLMNILNRGDNVVVNGLSHVVSRNGPFTATLVTLDKPYIGPTLSDVDIYKASTSCQTGIHIVQYTPNVRGLYELNIKLDDDSISGFPKVIEVVPGKTDPDLTIAYGMGLSKGIAGRGASFTIQAKDAYGNNRMSSQETDFFIVLGYPENGHASPKHGELSIQSDGAYSANFVPEETGYHTVVIVQASPEIQTLTSQYQDTGGRSGFFSLAIDGVTTDRIPWNADTAFIEDSLKNILHNLDIQVTRQESGSYNFKYSIIFGANQGDVTDLVVDVSGLGNSMPWTVDSTNGKFSHIMAGKLQPEVQKISVSLMHGSSGSPSFILLFMGLATEPIAYDTSASALKRKLEALETIGQISVAGAGEMEWIVTFEPNNGNNVKSLRNFGDLPELVVGDYDPNIVVSIQTLNDGSSPFRMNVFPDAPSTVHTTAEDSPGVPFFEGTSAGIYKTYSHFQVQVRDRFSNEVTDGPLSETQVCVIIYHSKQYLSNSCGIVITFRSLNCSFSLSPCCYLIDY